MRTRQEIEANPLIWEIPIKADYQYFCCERGRVFRFDKKKGFVELKGWPERSRLDKSKYYRRYSLKINGVFKKFYGQRLVCFTFKGIPERHTIALHGNGDTMDNGVWNVKWGTYEENNYADRIRDGTLQGRKKQEKIGDVATVDNTKTIQEDDIPFSVEEDLPF